MRNQIITISSSASITLVLGLIFIKPETIQNLSETAMIGIVTLITSLAALCLFLMINYDRLFLGKQQNLREIKK